MTRKHWFWITPLVLVVLAFGVYSLVQPRFPYRFLGQHRVVQTWRQGPWIGYLVEADIHALMKEADAEFAKKGFPKQDYTSFPYRNAEEFSKSKPDIWFTDNVSLVGDPVGYNYRRDGGRRKDGYCLFYCMAPEPSSVTRAAKWLADK